MLKDSWKNKNIFLKQLELNKNEFLNYPDHWKIFVKLLNDIILKEKQISILDIGCGCGAFYKLCLDNFKNSINYTGIDYSSEAIEIAKKTWNYDKFYCKDLFDLDKKFIQNYDLLHLGALLDVLENADDALNYLLSFSTRYVYIGRIEFKDGKSQIKTYNAYDEIVTYKHIHGKDDFLKIIENNNYIIVDKVQNNILLEYKK
jgi:SAM-dependent methyltransferase